MILRKNSLFLFLLSLLICFASAPASATTTPSQAMPRSDSLSSCSAFYDPNQILFRLKTMPENAIPGHVFTVSGSIENNGGTPVSNASLFVAIRKANISPSIDRYSEYVQVSKNMDIASHSQNPITYSWNVPAQLADGTYLVDLFLVTGENIKIPLSDGNISVKVKEGNKEANVSLVSSSFSSLPSKEIISIDLKNTGSKTEKLPVSVKIYEGDFIHGEPIETINKVINVGEKKSVTASFNFFNYKFADKYYVIEFPSAGGVKNIYAVSRHTKDLETPRIEMLGLNQSLKNPVAYACIEPIVFRSATAIKLSLRVLDRQDKVIKEYSREDESTNAGGAIKMDLSDQILKGISGMVKIEASLYESGALIDKRVISYDCNDGIKIPCMVSSAGGKNGGSNNTNIVLLIFLLCLLLLLSVFFVYKKNKKGRSNLMIFLIMFCGSLCIATPAHADWKAEIKNNVYQDVYGQPGLQTLMYEFGPIAGNYFKSLYNFYDTPIAPLDWGRVTWTGSTTSEAKLADVYAMGGIEEHMVTVPLWLGVYIIDLEPQGTYDYWATDATGHKWSTKMSRTWVTNPDYTPSTWKVPIGTKIGFYVSPSQVKYAYNDYFKWWEGFPAYGHVEGAGEYMNGVATTTSLGACHDDWDSDSNALSDYFLSLDSISQIKDTPECNNYTPATYFDMAFRLQKPTISLTGLSSNFSCGAMQSDGTIECTATALGTSTPTITVNQTDGRLYGASSYDDVRLGGWKGSPARYSSDNALVYQFISHHAPILSSPPPSISAVDPAYSWLDEHVPSGIDDYYVTGYAQPKTLTDGNPGVSLPSLTFKPFGQVVVTPRKYPPTAPVVTTLNSYTKGWGDFSYLFNATATDPDSRIAFNVDWDIDGSWDQHVSLYDTYYNATSSSDVNQPGYSSSDPSQEFTLSGDSLRFNYSSYDSGTTTFAVQSIDPDGLSSSWTNHSVYTPPPPPPPLGFTADTAACDHGVNLSWNLMSGVTGYKLYRYNSVTYDYDLIATLPMASTTYQDLSVEDPEYGYYQLTTYIDGAVQSSPVDASAAAAASCDVVNPPGNFAANTSPNCGGKVDITWTAPEGVVTGYDLERLVSSVWTSISTASTTSYTDTDASAPGETRYYRIRSRNGSDTSDWVTDDAVSSLTNCHVPPDEPTNLIATPSCGGHIALSWTAPPGIVTGYKIFRDGPQIGTSTVTNFTDNSAPYRASAYVYNVQSYNSYGVSTSTASVSNNGTNVCTPPTAPTITSVLGVCNNSYYLKWTTPVSTTGFELWRSPTSDSSGSSYVKVGTLDLWTAGGYTDITAPDPSYYKVKAVNSSGPSPFSAEYEAIQQSAGSCANVCIRDGITLVSGQSHVFYKNKLVSAGSTCPGFSAPGGASYTGDGYPATLICTSGTLFNISNGVADPATSTPAGIIPNPNPIVYPWATCNVNANVKEI